MLTEAEKKEAREKIEAEKRRMCRMQQQREQQRRISGTIGHVIAYSCCSCMFYYDLGIA